MLTWSMGLYKNESTVPESQCWIAESGVFEMMVMAFWCGRHGLLMEPGFSLQAGFHSPFDCTEKGLYGESCELRPQSYNCLCHPVEHRKSQREWFILSTDWFQYFDGEKSTLKWSMFLGECANVQINLMTSYFVQRCAPVMPGHVRKDTTTTKWTLCRIKNADANHRAWPFVWSPFHSFFVFWCVKEKKPLFAFVFDLVLFIFFRN